MFQFRNAFKAAATGGALAAALLLWPGAAHAAAFTVNTTSDSVDVSPGNGVCADAGGHCSLRAAVMEANALAGADTIILPAGDYQLNRLFVAPGDGIIEADASSGDLDLNSDITITGAGAGTTIIEGATGWNDGIMDVNSNLIRAFLLGQSLPTPGVVSISGVTIQGGNSSETLQNGGEGGGIGVALWGAQGGLTLQNDIIQNNYTLHGYGGGVGILNGQAASSVEASTVQITGTTFNNNTAFDAAGGGLFVGGYVPVTITNCTFTGNRSGGANPRNLVPGGGGAYLEYDGVPATITGSTFSGNTTDDGTANDSDGGGMATARGVTVKNSTFSGNLADRNGGGVDLIHTGALSSSFVNVTISGNSGYGDGAGLHAQLQNVANQAFAPNATLTNVTITNNRADADGNSAGTAGGLFRQTTDGTLTLQNTIVAGNFAGTGATASDASGAITGTYNLFGTGGSGTLAGGTGNLYNVASPGLGALADNGGPVLTHALLSGSPALDAGNNALVSEPTDARGTGFARKLDAADVDTTQTVDIGALEQHPTVENIADKLMLQDTSVSYLFNLGDATLGFTGITATSSNTALVPNNPANLAIAAGTGASNRNLNITPVSLQAGTTTITVTVTGVENGVTLTSTDTFVLTVQKRPDLTIAKSHAGNFRQGDKNDTYTITVSNKASAGPSLRPGDTLAPAGTTDITVTDTLPSGLTPAAAATKWSGTNWSCSIAGQAYTCTYAAALAPGAGSAPLSLILDVDDNAGTPVTNQATAAGGAELAATTGDNTASDLTVVIQTADLTVSKSHTDPFRQGESGDAYTIHVSNIGPGPTDAAFTVSDTLPAGLTPTAATPPAGEGWTCSIAGQAVTCTRANPLANGSASDITVTVDVAPNAATAAPNQLVNTATVAGGGELASRTGNNAGSDTANITQMPDLTIAKAANGTFRQGQSASYTVTVTNSGYAATDGSTVTVTDALPAGLTYVSASGTGWTCSAAAQNVTCTSTDVVAAGAGFPALTLNVTVADNAGTPVVNTASVTGGGEIYAANSQATPVSTTVEKAPDLALTKSHSGTWTQGDTGKAYTLTVANKASAGATFAAVTVSDTLPVGLTYVSGTGTGWTCGAAGQVVTCTSGAVLAPGGSSAITLTVNVDAAAGPALTNSATVATAGELGTTLADNTASDPTAIVQIPDLTVALQHTDPFQQGETGAVYTVTVANSGAGATAGTVTVVDTLPTGLTYTGFSGADWTCSAAGQTVTCTSSAVLAGSGGQSAFTLTVDVAFDAGSPLTNTAAVSGGGEQAGQQGNNTASDPTTITPMPDLKLLKIMIGDYRQGQPAAYKFDVTNGGFAPTDGSTVTVTDTLPAELTYVSFNGSGWTCSAAGQTVTCTTTAVVGFGQDFPELTLNVSVAPDAGPIVVNNATVAGGGEIYTANDAAPAVTTPVLKAPDLVLTKSHSGTWTEGDTGKTYTLTVSNKATAGATFNQTSVWDTLPAGLSYVSATGTGWSCGPVGQQVACIYGSLLAPGAVAPDLTITVDVAPDAPPALTNTAEAHTNGELPATATDNTASDPTAIVQRPDLALTKSHTGTFAQGQTGAQYTITVANAGTGETQNSITLTDTLPAGLTPTAANSADFSCGIAGQSVTCTRSQTMPAGAQYTVTITVDVAVNAPSSVANTATVAVTGDVNNANDSATDQTTIAQAANLTVAKSHAGSFRQGQLGAVYTIAVANGGTGPTDGSTVTVTDTLPAGLTYVSAAGTGWACSSAAQTVTCTSTDVIAAGAAFPAITLTVNVDATAAASLINSAAVAGGGELITGDDAATDPTTVIQVADLTVAKSHTGTWTQGDTGKTYTITVTNHGTGPTDGTAVTVIDTLPAGLAYATATGTGWSCSAAAQAVTCTSTDVVAAAGAFPDITLTVNVAPNSAATLTNGVTVSGGGEVVTANDSASDPTTVVQLPNLTIAKSHAGNFRLGQKDAPYTIIVTNAGHTATTGTVTVTDTLPAGLTVSGVTGTGWTCSGANQTATCTRSDALAGSGSYPPITLTVNVAGTTPATVVNHAAVAGGSELILTDDTADDPTIIEPEPPRPPVPHVKITAPKLLTRESSIVVSGTANPGDPVAVAGAQLIADAVGNWSATVALVEGPNLITATSGTATDAITVVRDSTPPALSLTASAAITDAETVQLTATSEPAAVVAIDGHPGTASLVHLSLGINTFTATATDPAGNTATATVQVTRTKKTEPPVKKDVDPEQPADVAHDTWAFHLPAQVYGAPIEIIVQAPAAGDEAANKAQQHGSVVGITEVKVTDRTDDNAVHQFLQTVTITFTYDPAVVTDPTQLHIFWYNPATGLWVNLGGAINRAAHTITVETDHFSLFAALVPTQPVPQLDPLPATVNQPALTVTGTGAPGAQVALLVGGMRQASGVADANGHFSLQATLVAGVNRIQVSSGSLASPEAQVAYVAPPPPPAVLTDIHGHWAEQAINRMVGLGVVKGYADGTFQPENQVTRLEFAVMVARLLGLQPGSSPLPFTDSDRIPDWARPDVAAAYAAGIITGRGDGSFGPDLHITRAEMAVMLVRALRISDQTITTDSVPFTDGDQIPGWARDLVYGAAHAGLVTGYPDGSFKAAGEATRAEAVTMLDRLHKLLAP